MSQLGIILDFDGQTIMWDESTIKMKEYEDLFDINSPINEGHKSILLCHLANISQRTGRTLHCDPKNGYILNDPGAMKLWRREYEKGWEPKI